MKKVIVLQGSLLSYRESIFNLLANKYDLTLGFMHENKLNKNIFRIYKIPFIKFGTIFLPTLKFINELKAYDTIILMPDLHYLNFCLLPFYFRDKKVISWSIGMRASYKLPYDLNRKKTLLDYVFRRILNECDSNIFYYKWPLEFWGDSIEKKRVFIAPNTLFITDKTKKLFFERKNLLFLGSLKMGKGILELLKVFKETEINQKYKLVLIGDGELKNQIEDYIIENKLQHRVQLINGIYDLEKLKNYFDEALVCISPMQAGLSVIMSFGFGVPFLTLKNSITGGERLNIENNKNGILFEDIKHLKYILNNIENKEEELIDMGKQAKKYYQNNLNINLMFKGFENAIDD